MSNNVNCPYCKKNRPHGHKGCNEVGLMTILIKKKENKVEKKNSMRQGND